MRVVAGRFRGRALRAPPGDATRPITDRVKETLFNILGNRWGQPGTLPDVDVLDLFAGTAQLGIEALSRGARSCVFVERQRRALKCLRENLRHVGAESMSTVLTENAWTMRPPTTDEGFGLAFVDPPYRDVEDMLRVVDLFERWTPAVAPDGVIVFRFEAGTVFDTAALRGLEAFDDRTYARMRTIFLRRTAHADEPPSQ